MRPRGWSFVVLLYILHSKRAAQQGPERGLSWLVQLRLHTLLRLRVGGAKMALTHKALFLPWALNSQVGWHRCSSRGIVQCR